MRYAALAVIVLSLLTWMPESVFAAPAQPQAVKVGPGMDKPAAGIKEPAPKCRVLGVVYCSEYGTRYKDSLMLVFENPGNRCTAEINQDDGSFQAELPQGASYDMRIEFEGKSFPVGRLDIPTEAGPDCGKAIEIYHPGSMLELYWEAGAGDSGGGMDFKVRDIPSR